MLGVGRFFALCVPRVAIKNAEMKGVMKTLDKNDVLVLLCDRAECR